MSMSTRLFVVLSLLGGLALAGATHAVGATPPTSPGITISPRSGPVGTVVTVKGAGCPPNGWGHYSWTVHVQTGLVDTSNPLDAGRVVQPTGTPTTPIAFTTQGYPGRVDVDTAPNEHGRWTARFKMPAKAQPSFPPTQPGKYPVYALCYATEGAEAGQVNYKVGTFKVTAK